MSEITKITPQQAVSRLYEGIVYGNLSKGDAIRCEDIATLALTELAEIKKVVENWDEGEYYTDSIRSMKKIEDILKGEKK